MDVWQNSGKIPDDFSVFLCYDVIKKIAQEAGVCQSLAFFCCASISVHNLLCFHSFSICGPPFLMSHDGCAATLLSESVPVKIRP